MDINDKTEVRKKKLETVAISYSISTQSLYFTFKIDFKQEAAEIWPHAIGNSSIYY